MGGVIGDSVHHVAYARHIANVQAVVVVWMCGV